MKRLLSSVLALTLFLGSVPAQAQVGIGRISAPMPVSAPTPVPAGLVPAAGSLAPALSAVAFAVSPISAPPAIQGAHVPAARVEALPALPARAVTSAPVFVSARAATPIEILKLAAEPASAVSPGAAFDGALTRSAAATTDPVPGPEASAAAPKKPSLLARYREHRNAPSTPFSKFGKSLIGGAAIGAAVPVLTSAAPAAKLLYSVAAADAVAVAFLAAAGIVLWAARKLRRAPQTAAKPPPSKKRLAALLAVGLTLGAAVGTAPYLVTGPVVERGSVYVDQSKAAEEREHIRWISGGAVEDETAKMLAGNPIGRATLDALRDRFGVLRLPTFFISQQDDSYAQHENMFDGVYLNHGEILARGWTVEQFLKDPALQRKLVREMSSTVVHELTHAIQGRRPPWTPGYFKNSIEAEQEAFFQEMLFRLAELEADPAARNNGHDQWMVPDAADNLDGFLKTVAGMYEKNVVIGTDPYFNAYMAAQRARWPAFRIHIYQVLAARATSPRMAKMYMDKAAAAAKEAGLPMPAELTASR